MRPAQPSFSLGLAMVAALFGVAGSQCGDAGREATGQTRQAIIGGAVADGPETPYIFMRGPVGDCTGILIAPNLVATVRHCTAALAEGPFTCTSEGTLAAGSTGGVLGADEAPGQLSFFSEATADTGNIGTPDAVGVQIISTQANSVCADDLAFVVISPPMQGVAPSAIRLDAPTVSGENVSVWGYGLTETPGSPLALAVYENAQIVGVGAPQGTASVQPAPVRAVRVGPTQISCNGDSGGAVVSSATGALVAMVSLGVQSANGGSCTNAGAPATSGPLLSYYSDLIASAFSAAGASPVLEGETDAGTAVDASVDAGEDAGSPLPVADATTPAPDAAVQVAPPTTSDHACAFVVPRADPSTKFGIFGISFVLAMVARARRRARA